MWTTFCDVGLNLKILFKWMSRLMGRPDLYLDAAFYDQTVLRLHHKWLGFELSTFCAMEKIHISFTSSKRLKNYFSDMLSVENLLFRSKKKARWLKIQTDFSQPVNN